MKDPRTVLVRPLMTEKSMQQKDDLNVVTFEVATDANKVEIRHAIESIFNVRVAKVNTLNRQGKRKRNRRSPTYGKRSDTKRAIVTLAGDDRIDLFER